MLCKPNIHPANSIRHAHSRYKHIAPILLALCRGGYFCYTAENSHHLEAYVTSKNPQFQEEEISARKQARRHVNVEKSSKNLQAL
jgi:hypothetical protein